MPWSKGVHMARVVQVNENRYNGIANAKDRIGSKKGSRIICT